MNVISMLVPLAFLASAVDVGAQSLVPLNAVTEMKAAFPNCEIHSSSVGPLYGKNSKDVASSLYCQADSFQSDEAVAGPYALAILSEEKNGEYRLTYKTRGLLSYFGAEIKKGSLFLHSGFPGTSGGQTATSYDYQFRFDGRNLMLTGMTVEVDYIGNEEPTKDQQYSISVNYATRMVIDSRMGSRAKKVLQSRKVTLQEFSFEPEGL